MENEENVDDPMEIDESVSNGKIIENIPQTSSTSMDVVVLDDDEETNEKSKSENNDVIDLVQHKIGGVCINFGCKNGKNLINAPSFCLSYFRVKSSTKVDKKVCSECYQIAVEMYDKVIDALKSDNLLFNVDVPFLNDMVEIDDSDEEDITDENKEYYDEDNAKFIKENIESVLNEMIIKFNFSDRVKKEEDNIKERFRKTQEICSELSVNLNSIRKTVDTFQIDFYNKFKPEVNEKINALTIIDDYLESRQTIIREVPRDSETNPKITKLPNVIKPTPARKSFRNVKPVSYAELDDGGASSSPKPSTPSPEENKDDAHPTLSIEEPTDLPPIGPVQRPPLEINEIYYISRNGNPSGNWVRARLIAVVPPRSIYDGQKYPCTMYKLIELKQQKERLVEGKSIAYVNPCKTRLRVGERVIALFKEDEKKTRLSPYYPGIVAEPPYESNKFRYLIFFDIGYSQYVPYGSVNLVHQVSDNVWEDMPSDCRPFIRKHIESQDWPMVKLKKDQSIITEYNGKWMLCTVINVDCSLVQVYFEELNRFEWIYRGSRRIKEIYREELAATNRSTGHRTTRKAQPDSKTNIVQYTPNLNFTLKDGEAEKPQIKQETQPVTIKSTELTQPSVKAVARKSTSSISKIHNDIVSRPSMPFLPPTLNSSGPTSKIMYFTPRNHNTMRRVYQPHECQPKCKDALTHNFNKLRGQNPLSKPLLCGWVRMTIKVRGKKDIAYKAPCGRMIRNIAEVHYYLSITKSEMTVDLFDFNHMVRCLAEFSVDCEPDPKDLSKGQEQVPIPVINGINNIMLDFCNYSTKRMPMEGVDMNLDPDFLVCCDCDDDCIDKTKCACWKLTLEGAYFFDSTIEPNSVGYIYRRLQDQVVTGIYECNSRCKCSKTCLNRVAQNPMSLKLQVFRTHNRGWGIRCLNDVPQGSFICVYAGTIHTDQRANEDGKTFGDEYFAELDYIESVEKFKEDFEKEVVNDDFPEKPNSPDDDNVENTGKKKSYPFDSEFIPEVRSLSPIPSTETGSFQRRLRKRKQADSSDSEEKEEKPSISLNENEKLNKVTNQIETVTISDEEDEGREILSFNPRNEAFEEKSRYVSVRESYGVDERIYIMDAKNAGNIGRFLNHSCAPNVFVQNVFVDTHDPRFPWVAFFSSQYIRAGTELTWNYSYDVGSVPGKVLYCHCAALECKGRLL